VSTSMSVQVWSSRFSLNGRVNLLQLITISRIQSGPFLKGFTKHLSQEFDSFKISRIYSVMLDAHNADH
jgi:hypothetical protein